MISVDPLFPDVDDVLEIHAMQLEICGGSAGIRDRGLLESAVAQPQASFGGQLAHSDLFAMAAGHLFHVVKNHGGDRTAPMRRDCLRKSSWAMTAACRGKRRQSARKRFHFYCASRAEVD